MIPEPAECLPPPPQPTSEPETSASPVDLPPPELDAGDSQPSEIESQEELQNQESRMETDFESAPPSEAPQPERSVSPAEEKMVMENEFDQEGFSDKEERGSDRYGEPEEADIEDADVDEPEPDHDSNNSLVPSSPAVISPIGEQPPSPDRCSSNSDEPPPMLTAELPTHNPPNTSVFNFTEDEDPPPPLHMSMNGSPRKLKMSR
jgi:hypothetical protein